MWNTSAMDLDEWFKQIRQRYASQMQSGKGCTACSYGLFDISLADALEVAQGFGELATPLQERVCSKGAELYREIRRAAPDAVEPLMFAEDDPRIDQIVDEAKSPPCPFLGGGGECLIYEHRPLSCRLEGVPMVDVCEGLFGDWCEFNFTQGVPETRYRASNRTTIASMPSKKHDRPPWPGKWDCAIIVPSRLYLRLSSNTIAFGNTFPSSQRRGGCAERSEGADGVVISTTCFSQSDHPVCGASVASRPSIDAASPPPLRGGECLVV